MATEEVISAARPVDLAELETFEALGEEFVVPPACIDCSVLNAKKIAWGLGMVAPMRNGERQFFPESKVPELKDELVQRSDHAVSGACKYIVKKECWRYEEVKQ